MVHGVTIMSRIPFNTSLAVWCNKLVLIYSYHRVAYELKSPQNCLRGAKYFDVCRSVFRLALNGHLMALQVVGLTLH